MKGDEIKSGIEPFETDKRKKYKYDLALEDRTFSNFAFFMDGSRRTYKIGDIIIDSKKIYPVVVAQIRAGCTEREAKQKLHSYQSISQKANSHKDTLKTKKSSRLGDSYKLNILKSGVTSDCAKSFRFYS